MNKKNHASIFVQATILQANCKQQQKELDGVAPLMTDPPPTYSTSLSTHYDIHFIR